jgi:hypothetical protein
MAVNAGLVALIAKVYLQSANTAAAQRGERGALTIEAGEYGVHEELF